MSKKAVEIFGFLGEDYTSLVQGGILRGENIKILDGGAISSMMTEKKLSVGESDDISGIYTLCSTYDPEYEQKTTAAWVYSNICPESVLNYNSSQLLGSRLFVVDIGQSPKSEKGYRNVLGAFADGDKTYVFYDGKYNIIDQRRTYEYEALGSGFSCLFYSGTDRSDCFTEVCTLQQIFLDVISEDGSITTTLIDAKRNLLTALNNSKLYYSRLISLDGENFKYVSMQYAPHVGKGYTVYPDKIYTDYYGKLADYTPKETTFSSPFRAARYFDSEAERLLLLPELRKIEYSSDKYTLSEPLESLPQFSSAVSHLERLFGILDNKIYASARGNCTDFSGANLSPEDTAWSMSTSDLGGFSALASFDGKVVAFTKNSMITIRGDRLPFDISVEGEYGCVGMEGVCAYGDSLYFISPYGIMRYNGTKVSSVSRALPKNIDYSQASLGVNCGMLMLFLPDIKRMYFYEADVGQWTSREADYESVFLVGERGIMLATDEGGAFPYRVFDSYGDFSFKIALPKDGRKGIRRITFMARGAEGARLALCTDDGRVLTAVYPTEDKISAYSFIPTAFYTDIGEICFCGSGQCILYGIRVEYTPINAGTVELR